MDRVSHDWWLDMSELEYYAWYKDIFTTEELDKIENIFTTDNLFVGELAGEAKDLNIRDSKINFVDSKDPLNHWIFERLTGVINNANDRFFKFDLNRIESLQYTLYNEGQYYKEHMDMSYRSPTNAIRKLSFSMQLSDPSEYEGGELIIKHGTDPSIANKERGAITLFPSYIMHEVTPVTKGTRRSLVGWVSGPRWK